MKPQIYAACLAAYNAGKLHGAWIDATLGADHIQEEIAKMLAASPAQPAEEWAIHDYDDMVNLGEFPSIEKVAEIGITRPTRTAQENSGSSPMSNLAIAVTGSRKLPASHAPIILATLAELRPAALLTGCAAGADTFAAAAAKDLGIECRIFYAQHYHASTWTQRLAIRSQAMVQALRAWPGESLLLGVPFSDCPAGLTAGKTWQSCGSGTWSTIALAAGLGLRIAIIPHDGRGELDGWRLGKQISGTAAQALELIQKQLSLL